MQLGGHWFDHGTAGKFVNTSELWPLPSFTHQASAQGIKARNKVRFGGPYFGVIADSEGSGRLFVDKNCQLGEIVDRRAIVDGKRNVKFLRH